MTRIVRFGPALEIAYDDRVLEPREWTAVQSGWAAELLADAPAGPVLELCAGVGNLGLLALTLKSAAQPRHLVGVDLNQVACAFLRHNVRSAGLEDHVEVREGAIEGSLRPAERFALVIADPPWVEHSRIGDHPADPAIAIDGGPDGLVIARMCLRATAAHLLPGGSAILQLGNTGQVDVLEPEADELGLAVEDVREYERGVLARLVESHHA
jgi:release factor glutamine methyltransferase